LEADDLAGLEAPAQGADGDFRGGGQLLDGQVQRRDGTGVRAAFGRRCIRWWTYRSHSDPRASRPGLPSISEGEQHDEGGVFANPSPEARPALIEEEWVMASATAAENSPEAVWQEFSGRHAGHRFLGLDPLYALTVPIIDAIQAELPDFFTGPDELFERDLARTASVFFHGRAQGFGERYRQADPETGLTLEQRHERSAQAIDEMLTEELRRDGLSDAEIHVHFEQRAAERQVVDARQEAYVGWLVSNPDFRAEVADLRASWEEVVRERGVFPAYPRWPDTGRVRGPGVPDDFHADCYAFYERWGLYWMATWDWPAPMEPDLAVGFPGDVEALSAAGVVLFVPWYLLRGEKLQLQAVVQRARTACGAAHLRGWLHRPREPKRDEKGDTRFAWLAWIYRFHELALRGRYGPPSRGQTQRLDIALGKVLHRDPDTVRKARLELRRVLGAG
jgi:hypothetical protein